MKKLLIALVLASLFVLGLAVAVSADNGPHGSFTATTDACASCHRAHSAQYGSNSLLIANPEALCMSCHDGTGAGTNVHDGVYSQTGADTYYGGVGTTAEGASGGSLFAGGFVNTLMATAWSGKVTADVTFNAQSRPTTSEHNIDVSGTVWGSGAINTANGSMVLECTSCHDPHGTGGYINATPVASGVRVNTCDPTGATAVPANPCTTKFRSYRLLRWQPSGSSGFTAPTGSINWSGGAFPSNAATGGTTGWTVPDNFATNGTEWYTIGTTGAFAVGDYNAGNANNVYNLKNVTATETATYIPAATNVAYFCAQCHDRYFANTRLRNAGDASLYCGAPVDVPAAATNNVKLPIYATAPAGCEASTLSYTPPGGTATTYAIWGDNRDTGDTTYKFMHSSGDVLRASVDGVVASGAGTSVSRSCVACHVAHGTSAEMTEFASNATLAAVAGADVDNSVLLRLDNRSVCLRCHASTVNFVVGP